MYQYCCRAVFRSRKIKKEAKDADNKMIVFSVFCCVVVAVGMLLIGGFFPHKSIILPNRLKHWLRVLLLFQRLLCRFVLSAIHLTLLCVREARRWLRFYSIQYLHGSCSAISIYSGTLYRTWNCECIFPGSGNRAG